MVTCERYSGCASTWPSTAEFALLAELRGIHIRGSQRRFIEVLPVAAVVVMVGDDVDGGIAGAGIDGERGGIAGDIPGGVADDHAEKFAAVGGGGDCVV